MTEPLPPVWLTRPEVAARLRLSKDTLAQWAVSKQGPPIIKIGGQVRYKLVHLEVWEDEQGLSESAATVAPMAKNNVAHWAVGAGNKFREVIRRTTENPTTKALAEGL